MHEDSQERNGAEDKFVSIFQFVVGIAGAVSITILSAFAMFPTKESIQMEFRLREERRDDQMISVVKSVERIEKNTDELREFIRRRR